MDWPATLPLPALSGYSLTPTDALARTDMETGPARVRRRYRGVPDTLQAGWSFTKAQMAEFRDFFENDIYSGSAWFNLSCLDGNDDVLVVREARFIGPFSAQLVGPIWQVTAKLELRHA